MKDLYSAEYFKQRTWERARKMKPEEFEPWADAKARWTAEKLEPDLQKYRESDQDWFSNWSRRRGECMHSSDLIFRLQRLNPHIFVQAQINFADDWGLYTSALGRVQFLTGFPRGWLTEFSYALVDDRNLPTEEKRGWRTVLIYCLLKGAITWEQILAEFGEPSDAWNEQRWQETVADIRFGGDQVFQRNIANVIEI